MLQTSEFKQHWSTIREKLKDHWQQLTDSDLPLGDGEINSVIEKIARRTGASQESVEEFVRQSAEDIAAQCRPLTEAVVGSVKESVRESMATARDAADQIGANVEAGYAGMERFVRRRPAQSVAGAFATGIVAGILVGMLLRLEP